MPQFDARLVPARYAPAVLGCMAVVATAAVGVGVASRLHHGSVQTARLKGFDPKTAEHQAFAGAEARPGLSTPVAMPISVRPGETLTSAVERTGVAADEARQVVAMLGQALDTVHIKAGLAFQAAVAHPRNRPGPARLIGLSMKTGPASAVTLSRTFDGALRLREMAEKVTDDVHVASGSIDGSVYESALKAGASPSLVAEAAKLFAKKLDFQRDIHAGDQFRLAFDRKVTESGKTVETGDLLYAEIGVKGHVTRFYRFDHDGKTQFLDEIGQQLKALLLKTPLEGAHITSSFGMRLHPLLGYTRLHPGIDFGAPTGTPVFAAGDGVVAEAKWAGGYGHWLKLDHAQGWATGYGHLSAYAKGIKPGVKVHQGEVVAYVGSTGLSTGPHLHYEIIKAGQKINPQSAKVPQGGVLNAAEIADFKAQRARINALLDAKSAPLQTARLTTKG